MNNIESLSLDLDSLSIARVYNCYIDEVKPKISNTNNSLNIITQNIQSINCNFSNFTTLLTRSGIVWDVIVLSECWLNLNPNVPYLDNYIHAATTRNKTQNEGVVIYCHKSLQGTFEEPEVNDANCLVLKLAQETCIVGIYRPPSVTNVSDFVTSMDSLLTKLHIFRNVIVCGDINIDILPSRPNSRSHEYLNALATHMILPGHTEITHGRTCLDHMMIKTKLEASCFVVDSSITDHDSVALSLSLNSTMSTSPKKVGQRIDYDKLDEVMHRVDFLTVQMCSDSNAAANLLVSLLSSALKECTKPVFTPKRKLINKQWITTGLLRCMRNRDALHKKSKKNPDDEIIKTTYKRYRNFCTSLLKKAKRNYERQQIESARNNNKKLWEVIKGITSSNRVVDHSASLLTLNPQQSVNDVNDYFAHIGKKLAQQLITQNPGAHMPTAPSPLPPPNSFVLEPVDIEEVARLIGVMRDGCATGVDGISNRILKRYTHLLVAPITHICNLAISSGLFPSIFKKALIKPVHKGGERDRVDNYRPISILPSMSKILERVMNDRLVRFLESQHLLSSSQYGFRRGRSTGDAVLDLVNSIITALDDRKRCITVFLDLAKAFDTVSIPHLLTKLENLGVRGLPLELFSDYLTNRTQRVRVGDWVSKEAQIEIGVPQGSIVGPTLFLAYINELCELKLIGGKIYTFADDTALFFSGSTWEEVFLNAQMGLDKVCKWLNLNVLTLNVTKTKYMAFALRSSQLPPHTLQLTAHSCNSGDSPCPCPSLGRTDCIRYLGVILDQTLTFKPHIQSLVPRLRKLIYIFKALRHVADRRVIRMVYYALCQPLLEYCISTWGGIAKTTLIEVERAQRAILKVAAGLPFRYPSFNLYTEWSVLTVRQTYVLQTVLFKHSELNYDPELQKDKRRNGAVCVKPRLKTATSHHFYCFLGCYLYNKLNVLLNLYPLPRARCKAAVTCYLKTLDYQSTESLLTVLK